MKVLAFLVLSACALYVQANIADVINQFGLKDKLKAELPHLLEIAQDLANGQGAKEVLQEALTRHPEIKNGLTTACSIDLVQKVEYIKKACDFLSAPQQRGLLGNIGGKFKQEFQHLKDIASQITQGKSPVQFIKDLAKKGAATALKKVCSISFVKNIDYVEKACAALESVGPLPAPEVPAPVAAPQVPEVPEVEVPEVEAPEIPVDAPVDVPAGVPHTRGFGSFLSKVSGAIGNVPILGDQVNNIKQLIEVVKANKGNPQAIAQAVVQLGIAPTITTLCSLPLPVPGMQEACGIVQPLTGLMGVVG